MSEPTEVQKLAERLVRRNILIRYVEDDHSVLMQEEQLIAESVSAIQDLTAFLVHSGNRKAILSAIRSRVMATARIAVESYDLGEETSEEVLSMVDQDVVSIGFAPADIPVSAPMALASVGRPGVGPTTTRL